MLTFSLL